MQVDLGGKRVLVAITGSISAYKACELVRLFIKAGAKVDTLLTPSAQRFVSPLTFEALTRKKPLTCESESWSDTLNHIDITKQNDLFVIAPATANTINKLAHGIADTLLLQTALACAKPILIAPAANTHMLLHPATQANLQTLEKRGATIVQAQSKLLACGDEGVGALAEPQEIFWHSARLLLQEPFWQDREVIVTGGGTREAIDEVRYVGNRSSGKMASALAVALYLKGAKVRFITTAIPYALPSQIKITRIENAQEMLESTQEALNSARKTGNDKPPHLFMAAAVADYAPSHKAQGKLKKQNLGDTWSLQMRQNPDILKRLERQGVVTVAFKAETDQAHALKHAQVLLREKGVDAVCLNVLQGAQSFGSDENRIFFVTPDDTIDLGKRSKLSLSFQILKQIQKAVG